MNSASNAQNLDYADSLARYRHEFHLPVQSDGSPIIYFCGHSLGLEPRAATALVAEELKAWASLGVAGHFKEKAPWYTYHTLVRDALARLVGARPDEVVAMNSLTVNLHLMMATFYRPTRARFRILMEEPAFPSDLYAVKSQLHHHGINPNEGLVLISPRPPSLLLEEDDIYAAIDKWGRETSLVFLNGVNFLTGQVLDLESIGRAAHAQGCFLGCDLAHAVGNIPLRLHDWNVDFGVWCHYKYVNAGPGAVGGCFIHEKHGRDASLPRLAGWWGNDPEKRFRMQLDNEFIPQPGAEGWQVSNPPILSLAPLRASLALFDEAKMSDLRAKSMRMTAYLVSLCSDLPPEKCRMVTPADPCRRGNQITLMVPKGARALNDYLEKQGILCDFREPDFVRTAPTPLYNTFDEIRQFGDKLRDYFSLPSQFHN